MFLQLPVAGVASTSGSKDSAGGTHLEDCIHAFSSPEELTGDEKWYCPRCMEYQLATKKQEPFVIPQVLLIQLKRFVPETGGASGADYKEGDLPMLRKTMADVKFPHELVWPTGAR
jgi:ubiquitin C-terminal hydrolase